MQIQLEGKFQYLEERDVLCPLFDERHVFTIRRAGYGPYQKEIRATLEERKSKYRPLQDAFLGAKAKATGLASMKNLKGKAAEEFVERTAESQVLNLSNETFAGISESIAETVIDSTTPVAKHLIANATGFKTADGVEVEYSVELGVALLGLEAPYPDEYKDGDLELEPGMELGTCLQLWVLHESSKVEEYKNQKVEAAEKN